MDVRRLEVELDNIFIKGRRLHANIPIFQRANGAKSVRHPVNLGERSNMKETNQYQTFIENKSYAQVVKKYMSLQDKKEE